MLCRSSLLPTQFIWQWAVSYDHYTWCLDAIQLQWVSQGIQNQQTDLA